MPILADVFMLLSCPGCHGIQCFKLRDINEKKKGLARHLFPTQLHCLFIYSIATLFSLWKRLIYRRKTKDGKNGMMWMLELFVDVDKLVDITH